MFMKGGEKVVVVADLVMEDVESRALSTYPFQHQFWKRYVDDTCCALRSDLVSHFHRHLNFIENWIRFTLETESPRTTCLLRCHCPFQSQEVSSSTETVNVERGQHKSQLVGSVECFVQTSLYLGTSTTSTHPLPLIT